MKCINCNEEMILDDEDFRFKGCTDKYWLCENCGQSMIEKIRYGKSIKKTWIERE